MTEPWCRRPKAPRGDSSPDSIFCGVGRALTMWEIIEYHISIAYIGLIQLEQYSDDKYFALSSFGEFMDMVLRYSRRRHEIAHGRVFDLGEHGFYLCPNTTMRAKTFPDSTAAYYYASDDIKFYCDQFTNLAETAKGFAEQLAHRSLNLSG